MYTQSITLIKKRHQTKERKMVQCETTSMIEILRLDTETYACVLSLLSLSSNRAAGWKRSHPACPCSHSTSLLIVLNHPHGHFNAFEASLVNFSLCLGAASWEVGPLRSSFITSCRSPHSSDKICYH